MTADRTPKQQVVEKLLKEMGEFTSDAKIAALASKVTSETITDNQVRYIRKKLNMTKVSDNIRRDIKYRVGLDYKSPFK